MSSPFPSLGFSLLTYKTAGADHVSHVFAFTEKSKMVDWDGGLCLLLGFPLVPAGAPQRKVGLSELISSPVIK